MPDHVWAKILFFAAWFISVYVHELGHSLAACAGGDTEIGKRGGFSPIRIWFTNPFLSFVLPLVALVIGGLPLPGAAVQIRADKLRSRGWLAATFLAGPVHTVLVTLAFLCVYLLASWAPLRQALACLVWVNIITFLINITPLPPLDGFGVVSAWFPRAWWTRLPRFVPYVMIAVILTLFRFPGIGNALATGALETARVLGVEGHEWQAGYVNVFRWRP